MLWRTGLLYGILVFAPIIRGGNRPLALLVLEILSVILLLLLAFKPASISKIPSTYLALVVGISILPLIYLIPLPFSLWEMLPGRADYGNAIKVLMPNIENQYLALSMDTGLSWYAWLALLPPLAVFLYLVQATVAQYQKVAVTFVILAALQALLGLLQYSAGPHSLLRLGWESGMRSIGTYVSRDHLAGMLEMALPMALALFLAVIGKKWLVKESVKSSTHSRKIWLRRRVYVSFAFGFLSVIVFLGLIFTQSRTGVALSMFVIFITMFTYSFKLSGLNTYGILGSLLIIVVGLALMVGLVPVLSRFAVDPMQDWRWIIFESSWEAVKAYFPLGSGFGTYKEVYQQFHAPDLRGAFINNAHNDYLELLVEGGLAAALLLIWFMYLYGLQWWGIIKNRHWEMQHIIQTAAGIGLLALLLHSFVDFNLHIPANLIYFAMLAGIFFNRTHVNSALR